MTSVLHIKLGFSPSSAKKEVKAFVDFMQNSKTILDQRSKSHLFNVIKGLRYHVPENVTDIKKGHFIVILDNGTEMAVTRKFVTEHFEPEVIHSVLFAHSESYMRVSKKTAVVNLDNMQVVQMKYYQSHFSGVLKDGRVVDLEDNWVEENFTAEFIARLKREAEFRKSRFYYLPPGAPRTDDGSDRINDNNPIVKYRQHGAYSCLFSSVASALYFLGLHKSALHMSECASEYLSDSYKGLDVWPALLREMKKCCKKLQARKIKSVITYNIFENISEYPRVLQLQDKDGNTQHAVTIVGNFIFDANCAQALDLTRDNLDYCCSTDAIESTFLGVFYGYEFFCDTDVTSKMTFLSTMEKYFQ
jgi:hypothetical protein